MIRPNRSIIVLLSALLIVLTGCTSKEESLLPRAENDVVRIVSSFPGRGASAGQVKSIADAIAKAIAERGSRAGKWRVEYIPLEGGSDETGEWTPDQELANATEAASDPSVIAYIGPYNSGAAAVSLPVTSKAGLLEASPSATWPGLTLEGWDPNEPNRYYSSEGSNFVRLMPPDSVQAEAAAEWAGKANYHAVVVLDDGSSYSAGMADAFSETASSEITIPKRLRVQMPDVSGLEQQISSGEAIFYAPSTVRNAVEVARALDGKVSAVFATDTALDPQFIDQAGEAGKKWHVISNSVPSSGSGMFAPIYGPANQDAFPGQFAANAYSLTNLILDGVASGTGRDRAALLTFLHGKTEPDGTGPLFTPDGDPNSWTVSGYELDGNGFVFKRTFQGQSNR